MDEKKAYETERDLHSEWRTVGERGPWQETMPVWAALKLGKLRAMVEDGRWAGVWPCGPILDGVLMIAGPLYDGDEIIAPAQEKPMVYECRITNSDGSVTEYDLWRDIEIL